MNTIGYERRQLFTDEYNVLMTKLNKSLIALKLKLLF